MTNVCKKRFSSISSETGGLWKEKMTKNLKQMPWFFVERFLDIFFALFVKKSISEKMLDCNNKFRIFLDIDNALLEDKATTAQWAKVLEWYSSNGHE